MDVAKLLQKSKNSFGVRILIFAFHGIGFDLALPLLFRGGFLGRQHHAEKYSGWDGHAERICQLGLQRFGHMRWDYASIV